MAVTVQNRVKLPSSAVPAEASSGTTRGTLLGVGVVNYTVAGGAGGDVQAADFGLRSITMAFRNDAAGSSVAHNQTSVTTGDSNGDGVVIAIGVPL